MVFSANLQQGPDLRVHRRGPELIRVHLAKTLVAIDRDAFFASGDEVVDELVERTQRRVGLRVLRRLPYAILRLGRQLRRRIDRTATDRRRVGRRRRFLPVVRRRSSRRHDDIALQRRQVAVVGEQRSILAGGNEVDADRVLPGIAARAIFDLEQVAIVFLVALHGDGPRLVAQRLRQPFEALLVGEILAIGAGLEQGFDDFAGVAAALYRVQKLLVSNHLLQQLLELGAGDDAVGRRDADGAPFDRPLDQERLEIALVLNVGFGLAALRSKQRRLRDVDIAVLDDRRQLAVEKRQQQRADVRAVDVRVGHDDDAVIAELGQFEIFRADTATERRDHRLDLVAPEHLVEARLLDVQNLALERQDGLEAAIAPLLGRTSCRLALDDVQLAEGGIALLTVRQLAWQRAAIERALPADQVAGLASRFARPRRIDRFADDLASDSRVLFQVGAQLVVDDRLDDSLDLGVAKLGFRLSLELRMRNLDADDAGQAFADVVAGDTFLEVFREVVLRRVRINRARQRRSEAGEVRATLVRVDVVREGIDHLRVAVVPLQRDLRVDTVSLAAHVDRLFVDGRLVLVEVRDERDDAAVVVELVTLAVPLVIERDHDAAVEEGELA